MVLQSVNANLPPTPGRQVRYLETELEKKDAENEALRDELAAMTKALESFSIVKESASAAAAPAADDGKKKGKKDKNAPRPAVTAYKYFCAEQGDESKPAKELQQMWKECQGDARQKYIEMAAEDKNRFERENKEYMALQELYQKRQQDEAMKVFEAHKVAAQALANNDKDGKKKKKKAKKDPDAPKRAKSAYMFFCEEKRTDLTAQNPGKSPTEVTKILGEEWSKLDKGKGGKKGTKKYDNLAAKDKARYDEEKAAYDAVKEEQRQKAEEEAGMQLEKDREEARKIVEEQAQREAAAAEEAAKAAKKALKAEASSKKDDKPKKKKKAKKDPDAPKRAKSAYMFFCEEKRTDLTAQNPGKSPTEVTKILGEEWSKLDKGKGGKNGTKKYDNLAAKDKVRYSEEKAAYDAVREEQRQKAEEEAEAMLK